MFHLCEVIWSDFY